MIGLATPIQSLGRDDSLLVDSIAGREHVRNVGFALAVGGLRKTGANVLFCEIRKFPQNIGMAHAASKIFENVINRNSQTANARLAPPFSGLDRDDVGVVHSATVWEKRL